MSTNPYQRPESSDDPITPATARWVGRVLKSLAVVGALALLVTLFLPAHRRVPDAARSTACSNNLRQIVLALHTYEGIYHTLPPAVVVDANGKPLHSWRALILPFLDHKGLYDQIDFSKPWDDLANRKVYDTTPHAYRCPAAHCPAGHTTYLAVVAPDSCFRSAKTTKLSDVKDDHDLTLIVVEMDAGHSVHWMSPQDASEEKILDLASLKDGLPHSGYVNAGCASGNRSMILRKGTQPAVIRALISIDGRDDAVAEEGRFSP